MGEIGQRLRELRNGWMTQSDLAAAAGVSIDLVRKLEQGQRHTASVPSLQALAIALDADLATLLAKPSPAPPQESNAGIVPLRRILTAVDDLTGTEPDVQPLDITEAERTVEYLWGAYWSGRYQLLVEILPDALAQLRSTARQADTTQAHSALARAYQATGDTLVHMGQTDAAFLAIRHALSAADEAGDALLDAALRTSVSWQMLVQGRYDDSTRVALTAAGEIAPTESSDASQLTAYGLLTVTAATSAARALRADESWELLTEARETARRIGFDRSEHQSTFGPAKVTMLSVDCAVVLDDYGRALDTAKQLPRDATLPLASRCRHLADVALSQLRLDHDRRALDALLTAEAIGPEWIGFQTLPHQITRELLERENRRSSSLREFAARIGVSR